VEAGLNRLVTGIDEESGAPGYDLSGERLVAAAECASCIFRRECRAFGYAIGRNTGTEQPRIFIVKKFIVE
jgi:hypothetical protein